MGAKAKHTKKGQPSIKQSWVGNALGKSVGRVLGSFVGMGNNPPLEIDLTDAVTEAIDAAMGKPRPVEAVEADIALLQKELERSKQADKEQAATIAINPAPNTKQYSPSAHAEEKKQDGNTQLSRVRIGRDDCQNIPEIKLFLKNCSEE